MLTKYHDCCYCGAPATCLDHVIPFSYASNQKRKRGGYHYTTKDKCVGACSECNCLLSNYALFTIAERAEYLADRLATRYAKELELPFWGEEELAEMGERQRRYIIGKQLEREEVLDRIRHCQMRSYQEDMTIFDYWDKYPSMADLADEGLVQGKLPIQDLPS